MDAAAYTKPIYTRMPIRKQTPCARLVCGAKLPPRAAECSRPRPGRRTEFSYAPSRGIFVVYSSEFFDRATD